MEQHHRILATADCGVPPEALGVDVRAVLDDAPRLLDAPPVRPKPLSQDGLLGLFKGEAVGRV
jgi:hypothetical protein